LLLLFGAEPGAILLLSPIAAGLLAGALATAMLYAFRTTAAAFRRWLAWPVAAFAGGLLFFATMVALFRDWRMPLFVAGIWTFGWLCFLWQPALLAKGLPNDAEG
jgi:hypothetical protein